MDEFSLGFMWKWTTCKCLIWMDFNQLSGTRIRTDKKTEMQCWDVPKMLNAAYVCVYVQTVAIRKFRRFFSFHSHCVLLHFRSSAALVPVKLPQVFEFELLTEQVWNQCGYNQSQSNHAILPHHLHQLLSTAELSLNRLGIFGQFWMVGSSA